MYEDNWKHLIEPHDMIIMSTVGLRDLTDPLSVARKLYHQTYGRPNALPAQVGFVSKYRSLSNTTLHSFPCEKPTQSAQQTTSLKVYVNNLHFEWLFITQSVNNRPLWKVWPENSVTVQKTTKGEVGDPVFSFSPFPFGILLNTVHERYLFITFSILIIGVMQFSVCLSWRSFAVAVAHLVAGEEEEGEI